MILKFNKREVEDMIRRQLEAEGYKVLKDEGCVVVKLIGKELRVEVPVERPLSGALEAMSTATDLCTGGVRGLSCCEEDEDCCEEEKSE